MHFLQQLGKKIFSAMRTKRTLQVSKPQDSSALKRQDHLQLPIGNAPCIENNSESSQIKKFAKDSDKYVIESDSHEKPDSSMTPAGDVPTEVQSSDGSSDSQKTLPDTQPVHSSDDTVTSSLDYYNNQVIIK